jgi:dTDP-4-amino-4,6-dideoxygalactose transaminase
MIGPQTKGLYLIHYLGFPGPARAFRALADRHGLAFIEDCALSLLSCDGNEPLGVHGDASVYCLYKTLPTPHGGVLITHEARRYALPVPPPPPGASTASHLLSSLIANLSLRGGQGGAALGRAARTLGRAFVAGAGVERVATGTQHFDRRHVGLGMSPLAKRIALAQDTRRIVELRRRNFFHLLCRLRDVAPPLFLELPPGVCPLFYPLVVDDKPAVMAQLRGEGVETVNFWQGHHPSCDASQFPDVARLRRSVVEVPCHQDVSAEVLERVVSAVRRALSRGPGERAAAGA